MKRMKMLSPREAALMRRCTLKYIYDLLYAGRLPGAFKAGRQWKIPAKSLEPRRKTGEVNDGQ